MDQLTSDHLARPELDAGLDHIRMAPSDLGTLELIVRRPAVDQREELDEGVLDFEQGLVGDSWRQRGGDRLTQMTVMNARVAALVARSPDRWGLAGDQLYVDLDIGEDNLPPGALLGVGSALLEVSHLPHTGCSKFSGRFGLDALRFVNSPEGRSLRLRGMNAWVVEPGVIRRGDQVRKL
ncbi:MAG TPA: MOSC domain-containing protein [Acidimicrobiia bacterium]|jgi:MOSC domain-containing protein YiiM|nr:MOSC domain-containing protein [Acidimicrobiia bacterium]